MDLFFKWVSETSLHGIRFAFSITSRPNFSIRKIWRFIVIISVIICLFLQIKLLIDIIVVKPKVVNINFELKSELRFPNVVICNLNPRLSGIIETSKQYGNIGYLGAFFVQMNTNLLYDPVRRLAQQNLTKWEEKYPRLEKQYQEYRKHVDPKFLQLLRKCLLIGRNNW